MNKKRTSFCLPGDLYEIYAEYHDDEALIAELSKIESRLGKYAIWGNRDYGGGSGAAI